ncbi:S15 peptidase family protein [Mycobacterium antarcticum]|uniref:S15 peptidase family protein n=1 Tax=Mycolicibacterium sp. TUM20985 TaxID=3023370 RepID=UPI00257273B7|nr:CocE/NonD family hydrolase [Mycolicibacterium sp. TUM20985]
MGAGAYVGRIGGLAVALGIGAAVFTGQAVASAEPDGSTTSSGATAGPASTSTSSGPSTESSGTDAKTTPEPDTSTDEPAPSRNDDDRADHERPSGSLVKGHRRSGQTSREPSVRAMTVVTDREKDQDQVTRSSTAPAAEASTEAAATPTAPTTPTPPAQESRNLADVTTTAVTSVIAPQPSSVTGDTPIAPAESPLAWTLLAATRREPFGSSPAPSAAVTPVGNSLVQPVSPVPVVAITQTAPLEILQRLPVIGPLLLTPIVAIIHQIPLIGDVLHPYLGYPVQWGLAPGTPVPRDVKVVSFDGAQIYVHFFPAAGLVSGVRAPTVLDGPGLALPGSTNYLSEKDEFLPNDVIGIGALRNAGYNVVTWDPRGEWSSGGQLEIDSPDFEARDVSAIISWLATLPEVQLDHPEDPAALDPRLGMVGASYGGGIQLVTAAIDHRIDAIVPTIAWNSLNSSLYKNESFKSSWGTLLVAALAGTFARPNPALYPAAIFGALTGLVTPENQTLLDDRGPGDLVGQITAPTLLIQGTVDTLFTLAEADANAKALLANHVDTKVVWFCGGHGTCVSSVNDGVLVQQSTLTWLAHYVKQDASVSTGPAFEWVDQHGTQLSSDGYPVTPGSPLVATSTAGGVLPLVPFIGGSGPQLGVFLTGPLGALLGLPSGAAAFNAYNLTIPAPTATTYVVGAPELTFTYTGLGTSRHVYAQLVDDSTGLVLGNLVTPVPVTLDGQSHVVTVKLEQVAQTLAPGQTVTLQLVASAVPYETINSLGALQVSIITLTLPTADPNSVTVRSQA